MQIETPGGLIATTSWTRMRGYARGNPAETASWVHGVQPAWSLDVLWLPADSIRWRRFFTAEEVLLNRLPPQRVVQRSSLAGGGRPWQNNRNADGGPLVAGNEFASWGFGVHAHNELHFPLPSAAQSFRSELGLDRAAGSGGCVTAQVRLIDTASRILFASPPIIGSQTVIDTGDLPLGDNTHRRTLVLQVNEAHDNRPAGADPLDIRDAADWLEPTVTLRATALLPQLAARAATQLPAWRNWRVESAASDLAWFNVWDELSGAFSSFSPAVASLRRPLVLRRDVALPSDHRWLVVHTSHSQTTETPPRIEVIVNGETVATCEVPRLDRDHLEAPPLIVPLAPHPGAVEALTHLEIRQLPVAARVPVRWHGIALSKHRPDLARTPSDFDNGVRATTNQGQ